MSKIIVKNSCIMITDYVLGKCTKIENCFRMYNMLTHQHYYIAMYYDNENKILYLPRGIDIWFLEKQLGVSATVEKNQFNPFDKYDDILIKYLPRDDVQKEALRFTLGKEEYSSTINKSQLSVNLNTGKGKTYVSIATTSFFGIKSAIITYSKSWLEQWKKCIVEYTNITPREVYLVDGTPSILRLLEKGESYIRQIKVFLFTHATIKSFGDSHGWNAISELFKHLRIGIKIFDEAHLNFENMCMIDFFTNVYKTYYLTATAVRSSEDENRIYQMCFKNVLAIDLFNEEEDPHTQYIAMKYNSLPTPLDISDCKNQYGLDRNKYTNYITKNHQFYMMLTILMDLLFGKIVKEDEKVLMYIGTNQSIKEVYEFLVNEYPEFKNDVGIFTSISENKQNALSKRIILSTTKSAGAAVDIKGLKVTVVLAEPFKSEVIARQTLGRTRSAHTYYIELVDTGFYYCTKYYNAKLPIFNKYATDCQTITISKTELVNRYNSIMAKRTTVINPIEYTNEYYINPIFYVY